MIKIKIYKIKWDFHIVQRLIGPLILIIKSGRFNGRDIEPTTHNTC